MNYPAAFVDCLKEGETILWTGSPLPGIRLRDTDLFLIPISIMLLGFGLILDYVLLHFEAAFIFKVLGVGLLVLAVYLGCIRILLNALRRKNIFYCITNKRVLMLRGKKKKLLTLPLRNIDHIDKTEERDGSGFIIFGNTNPLWPWLFGGFYFAGQEIPGLHMIGDVAKVFELLSEQIEVEIPLALREKIKEAGKEQLN